MMKKGVTLIELLISMALFSVIILAAISFNVTSSNMLKSSEKKTEVLNDLTYITDRIQKSSLNSMGWKGNFGVYPDPTSVGAYDAVAFRPPDISNPSLPGAIWEAYYPVAAPGGATLVYCGDFDYTAAVASGSRNCNIAEEILSHRVLSFYVDYSNTGGPFSLDISVTGQYDLNNTTDASTNPQVIVNTTIFPGQQSLS